MRAFLMAAGRGTRLAPLTDVIPKPLMPVANEPAIARLLRMCALAGIRDVVVNASYEAELLQAAIGDGSSFGVNITWSVERELLGTAGGMKRAESSLRDGDEPVVVLSGDGFHDIDIGAAVRAHRASGALATIVLTEVDDPSQYGVAITDDGGRITAFQEKPSVDEALSRRANTGVYVFAPEVFDQLPAAGEFYDFGSQLFPTMLENGQHVHGVTHAGYWNDIGTHEQFRRANFAAITGEVAPLPGSMPLVDATDNDISIHPTARIDSTAELTAPIVIGPDAVVAANARIARSVILPGAVVPEGALVAGATYGTHDGLAEWARQLAASTAGAPV